MRNCCWLCLVVLLFSVLACANTYTYTYTGNAYTENCNGVCPSLTGSFTLAAALAPNLSYYSFTPDQFSFTDGNPLSTLNSSDAFDVEQFWVSTDSTGGITYWTFSLSPLTYGSSGPCASNNVALGSYSTTATTNPSGDWSCYLYNSGTSNLAWGGGDNHGIPGVWTETSTISTVPEPSSMMLFGSGVFGLLGAVRRWAR